MDAVSEIVRALSVDEDTARALISLNAYIIGAQEDSKIVLSRILSEYEEAKHVQSISQPVPISASDAASSARKRRERSAGVSDRR